MCLRVRFPLFPMFFSHCQELRLRFFYFFLSFFTTLLLFSYYLPKILLFFPFLFVHSSFEDVFLCSFYLSVVAAIWVSAPLFFWFFYLFFKPALLPVELSLLSLSYTIIFSTAGSLLACAPLLASYLSTLFDFSDFDSFLFYPTVLDLLSFALVFSSCVLLVLFFPFLIFARPSRTFLYLSAFLFALSFLELPLFFFIFFLLCSILELTTLFFFFVLAKQTTTCPT